MTDLVHQSSAYDGLYRAVILTQVITAEYLEQSHARIADYDRRLAGFYALLAPGRGGEGEGELDYMFVADELQGRGVGRVLMHDLHREAVRLGITRVHIVSHPPAAKFYQAMGARHVGEIPPRGAVTWARPLLQLRVKS
jgi:GNAT superfamily N-acetyltransferase